MIGGNFIKLFFKCNKYSVTKNIIGKFDFLNWTSIERMEYLLSVSRKQEIWPVAI